MDSLPKQFVSAMRTLFDIMDDKRIGYVRVTDIENRWRDDRTRGLPRGVVESLQKVASHDGMLTFDRFCTGLKICLLRNQVDSKTDTLNDDILKSHTTVVQSHRPPSAPILDITETHGRDRNWDNTNVSANHNTQHRTISMPLLLAHKEAQVHEPHRSMASPPLPKPDNLNGIYGQGPPKPPRLEKPLPELKELTRSIRKSEEDTFKSEHIVNGKHESLEMAERHRRGLGDGRPDTETSQLAVKRVRRREPRRHTLHNGVDYNLLKRMKQIEQEKDILQQGLASLEKAREWYLKQLAEVQERMRYAGRMGAYLVMTLENRLFELP